MPKVSVIIPCYNVDKYVERCLQSLINQTLKDIEIICIDDKSTDDTLAIIQKHAKSDKRIHIVKHKKNSGAAVARNSGLDAATGEFIGFVDPDDYIDTDFYEKLYNCAKSNNVDIAKANVVCTDSNTGAIGEHWLNKYVKRDILYFSTTFWSAIYNHEFLIKNNIQFPDEIRTSQDSVFLTLVTLNTDKIAVIDDTYYHYFYQRAGSLDSAKLPHWKAESKLNAFQLNRELVEKSNLAGSRLKLAIEQHCIRHALYELQKTYDNDIDQQQMFQFLADILAQHKTYSYINKHARKHVRHSLKRNNLNDFIRYHNLERQRYYLFNLIPFINLDTLGPNKTVFLFDFIPVVRIFENRKWYLFGCIPILKIKR